MPKEAHLFVIAGPNGAGKSTNSANLIPVNIPVFDFDKTRINFYEADPIDHEFRYNIAYKKTEDLFTEKTAYALNKRIDFAYETNFFTDNSMYWPNLFKKNGFKIHLIFLALDEVSTSKLRVEYRVRANGHSVTEPEIEIRFKGSIKKVNLHFKKFDTFTLINSSDKDLIPLLRLNNNKVSFIEIPGNIPDYIKKTFKPIFKYVSNLKDYPFT